YDIGDLAVKMDRVDEELLFSVLSATTGGVWVLPASENEEVADLLDATAAASILNHLRAQFSVVVDCEHHMSDRTLAAFDAADRIVLVTQLIVPALRSTKRSLELWGRLGYPDPKLFVFVRRHQASVHRSRGRASAAFWEGVKSKWPAYASASWGATRQRSRPRMATVFILRKRQPLKLPPRRLDRFHRSPRFGLPRADIRGS